MKKWIALLLVLSVSLCLLAGCGSKDEEPAEQLADKLAEKPAEQPVEEPAEEPAEQPAEKPEDETAQSAPQEKAVSDGYWVVEKMERRVSIADTDYGEELALRIADLRELMQAYRDGEILEK